jgi:DNA-binding beta-propeller fold protein YncE
LNTSAFRFLIVTGILCHLVSQAVRAEEPDQKNEPWIVFAGTGSPDSPIAVEPSNPKQVSLRNVYGIEVTDDAIFFSTVGDHSIWKCDNHGKSIVRVAGTGDLGFSGDGGPALQATFNAPHEIRVDRRGNLYVADTRNHSIRRIDAATGIVETIAGDGVAGFEGDGGPNAGNDGGITRFNQPHSIVLDGEGGLLVADTLNHRLRRIDLETKIVTTIAGDGERKLPDEGKRVDQVSVFGPRSLAIDDQAIWLVLREGNSVWRIDRKSQRIHRTAGTGEKGHSGDGGDPLAATFRGPKGIAVDSRGNLLVVDTENQAVRYVDRQQNVISTLGIDFKMKRPHGTAVLRRVGKEDVYLVSDSENNRVLATR